jgi:hypothetical protein
MGVGDGGGDAERGRELVGEKKEKEKRICWTGPDPDLTRPDRTKYPAAPMLCCCCWFLFFSSKQQISDFSSFLFFCSKYFIQKNKVLG